MFEKIICIWKLLSNNGIRIEHSYEDIKRIKIINQASIIGLINTIIYIIVLVCISSPDLIKIKIESGLVIEISILLIFMSLCCVNLVLLNKYNYWVGAIFQMISIPTLLLTIMLVHKRSGIEFYYFPFLILLFYLIKNRKALIVVSIYYTLLFVLANQFEGVLHFELNASKSNVILYYLNSVISFITSILFLGLFITEYEKQQREITIINTDLLKNIALANQQKEEIKLMMKELSHRTKNNLQLVSSIINIQSKNITDPNAKNTIDDVRNRIVSIALLNQKLYVNNNFNTLLLEGFIDDLMVYLLGIYDHKDNPVIVTKEIDKIEIKIDNAIHIGLLINELLTNSFKHGIKKSDHNFIDLKIKRIDEQNFFIALSDSGRDISRLADKNFSNSFGASLIHSLVEQLKGEITFNKHGENEIIININPNS